MKGIDEVFEMLGNYITQKVGNLKKSFRNTFTKTDESPMGYKEAIIEGAIIYGQIVKDMIPFGMGAGLATMLSRPKESWNVIYTDAGIPLNEFGDKILQTTLRDPNVNLPEGGSLALAGGILGYGIATVGQRYYRAKAKRLNEEIAAQEIAELNEALNVSANTINKYATENEELRNEIKIYRKALKDMKTGSDKVAKAPFTEWAKALGVDVVGDSDNIPYIDVIPSSDESKPENSTVVVLPKDIKYLPSGRDSGTTNTENIIYIPPTTKESDSGAQTAVAERVTQEAEGDKTPNVEYITPVSTRKIGMAMKEGYSNEDILKYVFGPNKKWDSSLEGVLNGIDDQARTTKDAVYIKPTPVKTADEMKRYMDGRIYHTSAPVKRILVSKADIQTGEKIQEEKADAVPYMGGRNLKLTGKILSRINSKKAVSKPPYTESGSAFNEPTEYLLAKARLVRKLNRSFNVA